MRKYTVKQGDTLDSIAYKLLYDRFRAKEIKEINNLTSSQIYEGQVLKIPDVYEKKPEITKKKGLAIAINGKELISIPKITIVSALDSIADMFEFSYPVINDIIFNFASFADIDIYFDGEILLTGYISQVSIKKTNKIEKTFKGFSKTGILQTVNLPVSAYPKQYTNIKLIDIIEKLCDLFQIQVKVDENAKTLVNEKFNKITLSESEPLADIISNLCRKKGVIVSCTSDGKLKLEKDTTKNKPSILKINELGVESSWGIDAEKLFSDYTCLKPANTKRAGSKSSKKIDIDVFKPRIIIQDEDTKTETADYLNLEIVKSLLDSFSFSFSLPYVKNAEGGIFKPNQIITIKDASMQIPEPTEFLIKDVTLNFDINKNSADLELVPVNFYKGIFGRFWDEG